MASEVEICNLALARIGQRPVASLDEGSAEAVFSQQFYPRARRAALRAHPWNFATRVVALARSDAPSEYGYVFRYTLPSRCLRPIELTNLAEVSADHTLGYVRSDIYTATSHAKATVPGVAFKILGRDLLTNMENAKLAYIHDEDDPNQFDELFIDALSLRLAADLAGVFPESSGFQKNMMNFYQQVLFEARGVDASETKPSETATLVSVRG